MTITITSGSTQSDLTISGGNPLVVLSGGKVLSSTVLSAGSATLSSGGVGDNLSINSGGVLLGPGQLTDYNFSEGLVSGVSVAGFGSLEVAITGVASRVKLLASGTMTVESGATATATTVLSSGGLYVDVNGAVANTLVEAGGLERISSGGAASGDTVQSGGALVMLIGGTASDETVQSGGLFNFEGVLKSSFTLTGLPSAMTLSGVSIESGGILSLADVTVASGAILTMTGDEYALTVEAGGGLQGSAYLYGVNRIAGSASEATLFDSGVLALEAGGRATDTVLYGEPAAYGTEFEITSGAIATRTSVGSSGRMVIMSGGVASATNVSAGGLEYLSLGAVASVATVSGGGTLEGPGELIGASRIAGLVSGVQLNEVGRVVLLAGGAASGMKVVDTSLVQVESGARAVGTLVSASSVDVYSGGVTSGDALSSGAREMVSSGGAASGLRVLSGGIAYALAKGTITGALVSSGGREIIESGGLANEVKVLGGAAAYVYSGATDARAVVSSGGAEAISAGGMATALTVLAGGVLTDNGEVRIAGAGTLDGRLLGSGSIVETTAGVLVLGGAGAGYSGRAVVESGTIELSTASALGTGAVQFVEPATGSAVLQIDAADAPAAGGTFANTIINFNGPHEDIDLRSIAYVSGATAKVVGSSLVLTDGGATYTFNIAGNAAAAYPVLSDGHGGTLIDPKAVAFAQTAAAFAPTDAAKAALVSSASPAGLAPFAHAAASASHS
jgi:autotransporter passenger strand-loop-strand repeat protein